MRGSWVCEGGGTSQVASKVSPGPSQPRCHLKTETQLGTLPKAWEVTQEKLLGQPEMHEGCPEVPLASSRDGSPHRAVPSASPCFQILS